MFLGRVDGYEKGSLPAGRARCVFSYSRNGLGAAAWNIEFFQQNALGLSTEGWCWSGAIFACGCPCHGWTRGLIRRVSKDVGEEKAGAVSILYWVIRGNRETIWEVAN